MTDPDPTGAAPDTAPTATAPTATAPTATAPTATAPTATAPPVPGKRPLIERLGLAVIALGLACLFAVVAVAAFAGGEPFLGVMGALGCLMVVWVGGLTLIRG